jgi:hypothetical protein
VLGILISRRAECKREEFRDQRGAGGASVAGDGRPTPSCNGRPLPGGSSLNLPAQQCHIVSVKAITFFPDGVKRPRNVTWVGRLYDYASTKQRIVPRPWRNRRLRRRPSIEGLMKKVSDGPGVGVL